MEVHSAQGIPAAAAAAAAAAGPSDDKTLSIEPDVGFDARAAGGDGLVDDVLIRAGAGVVGDAGAGLVGEFRRPL